MFGLFPAWILAIHFSDNTIPAASPLVMKIGRFDTPTNGVERASWSGSAVEVRVQGSRLVVSIYDTGDNYLETEVNGELTDALHLQPGTHDYTINLPSGTNNVRLVKRTEAFVGPISFISFQGDGAFSPIHLLPHLIEFVGDSITCGYGNEGKSEKEHFTNATENADLSYAWIAARAVDAGARIIAWSGRKMWPDNTVPEIYDLTIPTDPTTGYDFAAHRKPDVVLINLATNDFGKANPDKAQWCAAYEAFISKIRNLYPKAQIYCAIGSMMSDNWPPKQMALTTLRDYIATIVADESKSGDKRVAEIEFDIQKQSDGLGADFHPSLRTHGIMAAKLVERLKTDLGW